MPHLIQLRMLPSANGKCLPHAPVSRNPTPYPRPLAVFPLVHECLLVGVSLVATLMQVLFQITLATQYSNSFEPCESGL